MFVVFIQAGAVVDNANCPCLGFSDGPCVLSSNDS
jgi:hypothetical protein